MKMPAANLSTSCTMPCLSNIGSSETRPDRTSNGIGAVAIRSSYNVSSITDNGVGDYTVNFTNAMNDANYCAVVSSDGESGVTNTLAGLKPSGISASNVGVTTGNYGSLVPQDKPIVTVAILAN